MLGEIQEYTNDNYKDLTPIPPEKFKTVSDFYKNCHLFITGATGFMGKVLVEKLLWECEEIGNLYLLVREKKGVSANNRLKELLKSPVFDRIRDRNPETLSKIIPISGDVSEVNLGISDEDRKTIEENVSIVFHVASSVRFDDPIKKAILLNVRGTRDVVYLSKNIKQLKVMAYVSTIYCNSDKKEIDEKVYTPDENWRDMIAVAETIDEKILNMLCPKIIGNRPNTYTFSKNLAENIIYEYRNEIPALIFRPSIVTFSVTDPIPGWLDNLNGPMGISLGMLTGVLHVLYAKGSLVGDYIPCDYAINSLICSAWYRGLQDGMDCLTINCASGEKKLVSPDYLAICANEMVRVVPFEHMLWYPYFMCVDNRFIYVFLVYLTHLLPAVFVDIILRMKGIKFSLLTLYRKVFNANECLSYFLLNEWKIFTRHYNSLKPMLTKSDQERFVFDLDELNETEALYHGFKGIKKYLLKEDTSSSSLEAAKRKFKRMYYLDRSIRVIFGCLLLWLTMKYYT